MKVNAAERIRRGKSLRRHIMWAMIILMVLIPVNFLATPGYPWWMWVMMGWLPLIAGHTAYAMGLFDRNEEED
jgi:uncharacterized membrane protein YdbT with pleckstrin-like domain